VHLNDIAWVGSSQVAALRQAGVDAELIAPPRPGAASNGMVRELLLPVRLLALAGGALRARGRRADLVHLHYARHGWVAPLLGTPYVLQCHGTDVRATPPGRGWGRIVERAMRGAAAVLYSTPDLEPWVAAYRPDGQFLPNPIPLPAPPARPAALRSADVLVGVRLDPIKGAEAIATLMAEVLRRRPRTSVTVIAHGSQVDRVRRALGRAGTLIPPVAHSRMAGLLADHRVAVGQIGVGILGNFELEAMAAGLPTAARFRFPDAYPSAPPVIDGEDVSDVARQLVEALDDDSVQAARGAASRAWIGEHHAPSRVAERLLAIYREALGARGAS
jgi:glycosyltransferase involved in cell wall biosynthesis